MSSSSLLTVADGVDKELILKFGSSNGGIFLEVLSVDQ
jgi:hypothetical protein